MNPVRSWLAHRAQRPTARAAHRAADQHIGTVLSELAHTYDPTQRGHILTRLADLHQQMARLHPAAYGPDPIKAEGGRDMAESLHLSELLLRLLADVEHVASGRPGERRVLTADLLAMLEEPDLGDAVHAELDRLAGSTELNDRLDLDRLYDLVQPTVGGQAAEILVCLPWPPLHLCWLCDDERWYPPADMVEVRLDSAAAEVSPVPPRACRACAANLDPARIVAAAEGD